MGRTKAPLIKINPAKKPDEVYYDSTGFVAFDGGHKLIKGRNDYNWSSFIHALTDVDETAWFNKKLRGMLTHDYYIVNGKRYAIGEEAEIENPSACKLEGAARYTADYHGVFCAITLFRLMEQEHDNVTVYASHPPEYINYRKDIKDALKGRWVVEDYEGNKKSFRVTDVYFYDEPLGGAMNLILTTNGSAFQSEELRKGRMLSIDIGGFTINVAQLLNGRMIDLKSDTSQGIDSALEVLNAYIRKQYARELKQVKKLDPALLRDALETGWYSAGGYGMLDVQDAAKRAAGGIVASVLKRFNSYGGVGSMDYVCLTGGGSGAFEDRLRAALQHPRVYLASAKERIYMANPDGGLKMMHFYKKLGAF